MKHSHLAGLLTVLGLSGLWTVPAIADDAAGLRGSRSSMVRQHSVAEANDFTFLRTGSQIASFVERGHLVPIEGNDDFEVLRSVSYPYGRPELRTFIERLGAQHRAACGERLVVTSITRPTTGQPANSHPLSVHPTGMAVDLRVLDDRSCREWLEATLLEMERAGLLDVTREMRPPHYHVAVFPDAYREYVTPLIARDSAIAEAERIAAAERAEAEAAVARLAEASSAMMSPAPADGATRLGLEALGLLAALPLALGALALRVRRGAAGDDESRLLAPLRSRGEAARLRGGKRDRRD